MTWDDFDRWSPRSLRGAAQQLATSGLLPEPEATVRVGHQLAEQLPAGIATPLHHLWTVRSSGPHSVVLGHLWMRVRPSARDVEAFVLDVEVLPGLRGRGWGRATMLAAEQAARALGASVVRLNVFAHNAAAVRLYQALEYDVVGFTMTGCLDGIPPAAARGGSPSRPVALRPVASGMSAGSSDHRRWQAHDGTGPVADVRVRLARRSDGRHAFLHELRLTRSDALLAVVDAVLTACRDLDAGSLVVSVPESLPTYATETAQVLVEHCGFRVAAQTMAKPI